MATTDNAAYNEIMTADQWLVLTRLLLATAAGGGIGLERTYHGRPAGFRTHALVCTGSALLMLFALHASALAPKHPAVDPTRMAGGIMTGIGFLGAGVIMKQDLSIRGLTTAASIWITAAIGIAIGTGFYFATVVAMLLVLGILAAFRWIESRTPSLAFGQLSVRCPRAGCLGEPALRTLIDAHHISLAHTTYRLGDNGRFFEYQGTMRTRDRDNYRRLAETLAQHPEIDEFIIAPVGD